MTTGLVVGSLVSLVACGSFAFVAHVFWTWPAGRTQGGATRAFALLWVAMSIFMAERGLVGLAAAAGSAPLPLYVATRYVEVVLVCVAAWGMTYYVAYLYTGWRSLRPLLAVYFLLVGLAYAAATAAGRPSGVTVSGWSAGLTPATPFIDAIYLAFGLPMLVSILAYLTFAGRPITPIQRYRVVLTSASLFAWVLAGLAASIAGDSFASFLAITLLGIVTALGVFLAHRPPEAVRRRLSAGRSPAQRTTGVQLSRERFRERVAELV